MKDRRHGAGSAGTRGEPGALGPAALRAWGGRAAAGCQAARASPPAPAPPALGLPSPSLGNVSPRIAAGRWGLLEAAHSAQTGAGGELGRARLWGAVLGAAFRDPSSARAPRPPRRAQAASREVPASLATVRGDARCPRARQGGVLASTPMNNLAGKRLEWGPGPVPGGLAGCPRPRRRLTLGPQADLGRKAPGPASPPPRHRKFFEEAGKEKAPSRACGNAMGRGAALRSARRGCPGAQAPGKSPAPSRVSRTRKSRCSSRRSLELTCRSQSLGF